MTQFSKVRFSQTFYCEMVRLNAGFLWVFNKSFLALQKKPSMFQENVVCEKGTFFP